MTTAKLDMWSVIFKHSVLKVQLQNVLLNHIMGFASCLEL